MPLDVSNCKLVDPALVGLFNATEAYVLRIRQARERPCPDAEADVGGPHAPAALDFGEVERLLAAIAADISKSCCAVGFLGVTGAGKSHTLNELIGYDLLPLGSCGHPCTNAITRIKFIPSGSRPEYELWYMTEEEFACRRHALASLLGLDTPRADAGDPLPKTDEQLIAELESLINDDEEPMEERDIAQTFLRFLRLAGETRGQFIRPVDERKIVRGTVADLVALKALLVQVAQHGDLEPMAARASTPYSLLAEVRIRVPLDRPPGDVELVDLPGILARLAQDDMAKYLSEMDGVFVAMSSQNLGLKVFGELKDRLKQRFGDIRGRTWIYVTKMDTPDRAAIQAPKNSIFHGIDKTVQGTWGFQGEAISQHLCLTSNHVNRLVQRYGPAPLAPEKATACRREIAEALHLDFADGQILMPPRFAIPRSRRSPRRTGT